MPSFESILWPLTSPCTWYLLALKAPPCNGKPICNQWVFFLVATTPIATSHSCGETASPRTLLGPTSLCPGTPWPPHRCRVPIHYHQGIWQYLLEVISFQFPDVPFGLLQCNPDVHPRSSLLLLNLLASITYPSSLHLWRHIWRVIHLNTKSSWCTYKRQKRIWCKLSSVALLDLLLLLHAISPLKNWIFIEDDTSTNEDIFL